MTKHAFQRILLYLLFTTISIPSIRCQTPKNVVVILVDDLGWRDLGYTGSALYRTPHLDALAEESFVFSQAYSAHPVCSPSRAAIMTGKHPTRLGITDWIPGDAPQDRSLLSPKIRNELALEEKTIAEYFKSVGYNTFYAGKWHLGEPPANPENQGFDINIGGIEKGSPPGGYYSPYKNPKLSDGPDGEYLTDRLTDETIRFIKQQNNKPFFAFLSYYTVHTPIQANKEDRPSYDSLHIPYATFSEHEAKSLLYQNNLDYASMVTAMDRNVGKLINFLKERNLWNETILLFTSDNGGLSTLQLEWTIPTSNLPTRAGKGWCYEGGVRIPQLLHIADRKSSHKTIEAPTVHQDILPTLWAAAGLNSDELIDIDGKDILSANLKKDRTLFWDYPHYHGSGWKPGAAIRQGRWKLIEFYEQEKLELYDLKLDPMESVDVSQKHPRIKTDLHRKLRSKIELANGKFPVVNPNYKSVDQ